MTGPADPQTEASPLTRIWGTLSLLILEGMSAGLAGWALRSWPLLPDYVASNALPPRGRLGVVISMAIGIAVAVGIGGLLWILRRGAATPKVERLAQRFAPLCLSGLLPFLLNWRCWVNRDLSFLVLAAALGLGTQGLFRISFAAGPVFPPGFGMPLREWILRPFVAIARVRWLPLALVLLGVAAYATYFAVITIHAHFRLNTSSFDLGIENNQVWNALHGGPLFKVSPHSDGPRGSHLGYHHSYFAYALVPFYRILQRPETLLVLQAILMAAAAIPLYGLARRKLGSWVGCLLAFVYLLYAPVQGSNLYDFHYLPFAPLMLWTTLYLVERGRDRWAILAVILALSLREDISLLLAVVGLYVIFVSGRAKAGTVLIAVGAVYFVVLKMIIMPRFLGGAEAYVHQYSDLIPQEGGGYGGVLKTVFGNPGYTTTSLLEQNKVVYLLQIIAPFAFLPWRRPIGLICSLPGFFFTLLSTHYAPLVEISFQYTAYWSSFLFPAVIANLDWISRRESSGQIRSGSRGAWLVAVAVALFVTSNQHGAVLQQNTVRGGFGQFRFGITNEDRRRHKDLYELIAQVPARAKITSSESVVPHVTCRPDSYTLRCGVFDADYILVRLPPWSEERGAVVDALKAETFGVVDIRGDFLLAKRGHSTARNEEGLSRLQ